MNLKEAIEYLGPRRSASIWKNDPNDPDTEFYNLNVIAGLIEDNPAEKEKILSAMEIIQNSERDTVLTISSTEEGFVVFRNKLSVYDDDSLKYYESWPDLQKDF